MKPNFALTLSFEGIGLLHRAFPGWHLVGEVALDSADLAGALAGLRDTAARLDASGLRCKLVIPEDQIKYLSLDFNGSDDAAQTARAALEGATPYAVDDLAIDWSVDDSRLLVAAVARETLAEAEAFATDHQFNPVCFVAAPANGRFRGEPCFGAASGADGQEVERDPTPIRVIGAAKLPDPAVEAVEHAARAVAVAGDPAAGDDPVAEPAPAPATEDVPGPDQETPGAAPVAAFASIRVRRDDLPVSPAPKLAGASRDTPPAAAAPDDDPAASQDEAVAAQHQEPEAPADPAPETKTGTEAEDFSPVPGIILAEAIDDPDPEPGPEFESAAAAAPRRTAFFTRRAKTSAPIALPKQLSGPRDEKQRMTVFGAREPDIIGGKPRYLGLVLTAALLLFLVGVAAWASIFMDDGLSRFFRGDDEPRFAALPVAEDLIPETEPEAIADGMVIAALPVDDGIADTGLQGALTQPGPAELTPDEARARYAATGIWQRAPESPLAPDPGGLDDFYLASVDPVFSGLDAISLPEMTAFNTDLRPPTPFSPAAAGTRYTLDARGFVRATDRGAVTPDGVVVYAGLPPLVPTAFPRRAATALPGTGANDAAALQQLGAVRPKARPGDLGEQIERGALGGFTRNELAAIRPKQRPQSIQETVAAAAAADTAAVDAALAEADTAAGATAQAVQVSLKPRTRPSNFAKAVARTQETQTATAVSVRQRVQPSLPTATSVAAQATQRNALRLHKVNLIGVYGAPSSRRALVRLTNGRYKKVKIGDRLDGGKVAAIGDSELRYVKNGRSVVLKMPKG